MIPACDGSGTNDTPRAAGRQAQEVSLVGEFITAFNMADTSRALALFADNGGSVGASDCDYRRAKSVGFRGRSEVRRWLEERFADDDRLTVHRFRPVDGGVVVDYKRRTSNALEALGFKYGIDPKMATKAATTRSGPVRITQFANAGNDAACRPGGLSGFAPIRPSR